MEYDTLSLRYLVSVFATRTCHLTRVIFGTALLHASASVLPPLPDVFSHLEDRPGSSGFDCSGLNDESKGGTGLISDIVLRAEHFETWVEMAIDEVEDETVKVWCRTSDKVLVRQSQEIAVEFNGLASKVMYLCQTNPGSVADVAWQTCLLARCSGIGSLICNVTSQPTAFAVGSSADSVCPYSAEQKQIHMIEICNRSPDNPVNMQTLSIDELAWPAYEEQGYTKGACQESHDHTSRKLEGLSDLTEEICKNASQESEFHWALDGSFCGSHVCNFDAEEQCGGSRDASDFCPGLSELGKQLEKIEQGVSDAYEQYKCNMSTCEKTKDEIEQECEQVRSNLEDGVTECLALAGDFRAKACAYGELLQIYRTERLLLDQLLAQAKQQEEINDNDWKSQMFMACQLQSCDPSDIPDCMGTVSYTKDIGILNDRSEEIADLDAKWNYEDGHTAIFEKEEGTIKIGWSAEGEPFEICQDFGKAEMIDALRGIVDSIQS